jgi:hypothetical protein
MPFEKVKGYELTNTLGNLFENTIAIARIIASGRLDKHPIILSGNAHQLFRL